MKVYTDQRLLRAGLTGGTFSRHSGNMRETNCQETAFEALGINPAQILHFHQTHSDHIITIHSLEEAKEHLNKPLPDADAWIFAPCVTGWGAAIVTADCVPLFIWDDTGTYAALAHCGWRGIVQELPQKVAKALLSTQPTFHFNAWIGPHIQACCFEVQEDVARQFSPECIIQKQDKTFVDLNVAIKRQLTQAGLSLKDIQAPYYCTCGDKENFFSWRRDHEKNMLLSWIYKP